MPDPVNLSYPFTGRWLVQNSPADRVPSHGTDRFATTYAIDFVPVGEHGKRTAPFTVRSLFRSEVPEKFPGFGRAVLAPADGVVVGVHDSEPDHGTFRGFPSVGYALSQGRRAREGWIALAGNHVLVDCAPVGGGRDGPDETGVVLALCHLRQGSASVEPGQRVRVGDMIGACGNSGNSTEPHLHLQVVDSADIKIAQAVPIMFHGSLPRNGDVVEAVR